MRIKFLSPRRASIGEQDIDVIRRLAHFFHQSLDLARFRTISRYGNGFGTRTEIGQGVQRRDSRIAC